LGRPAESIICKLAMRKITRYQKDCLNKQRHNSRGAIFGMWGIRKGISMKVKLDEDEYWPFYSIVASKSSYALAVSIRKSTLGRYRRIFREFHQMQKQLKKLYQDVEATS
jgi:hypothetical protein